jgi:hypothetical protein
VQQLSDADQMRLEAEQAAAVEQEDFESAAALDEQLQVGETCRHCAGEGAACAGECHMVLHMQLQQ